MPSITLFEISDRADVLARTAKITLTPRDDATAPEIEFGYPGDVSHLTVTDLRPDGVAIEVKASTNGGTPFRVFKGTVDFVDDLTDPDVSKAEVDMSDLPTNRSYKKRITAIYDDPLNGLLLQKTVITMEPSGAIVTTTFGDITAAYAANEEFVAGNATTSAKSIIRDICKKLGIGIGILDFPDYNLVGTVVFEHKTIVEIANELIAPFNTFPFLQHYARFVNGALHIQRYDWSGVDHTTPKSIINVTSRSKSFTAYIPDNQIGSGDVVLYGANHPSQYQIPHFKTSIRLPKADFSLGTDFHQFEITPLIDEREVRESVVTTNGTLTSDSPAAGIETVLTPDVTKFDETVDSTVTVDMLTRLLFTGYDDTILDKIATAYDLLSRLAAYIDALNVDIVTLAQHISSDYGVTQGAFANLEEYYTWVRQEVQKRLTDCLKVAAQIDAIIRKFELTVASAVTPFGAPVSDPLSKIGPENYEITQDYDGSGNPIPGTAHAVPKIIRGTVIYAENVTTIAQIDLKTTSLETSKIQNSVDEQKETLETNAWSIFDFPESKRFLKVSSTQELTLIRDGERERDSRRVERYRYDKHGIQIATETRDSKYFRETTIEFDLSYTSTPKSNLDYRLEEITDGRRKFIPRQLQNTIDDQNEIAGSDGGFAPYGGGSSRDFNAMFPNSYAHDWVEAQYKLLNGVVIDDTNFTWNMLPDAIVMDDLSDPANVLNALTLALQHNEIVTKEKLATKFTYNYMDGFGLQLIWGLMERQIKLENSAAYWEETKIVCTLDNSLSPGQKIIDNGSTYRIWAVDHSIPADEALTTVTAKRLITRGK